MKIKSLSGIIGLGVAAVAFTACDDDNSIDEQLTVPSTYEFMRDGESSVDFGGQTTRQNMLAEIMDYMNTATGGAALDETRLHNMYANENAPFEDPALNEAATKKLSSTTSASLTHSPNQEAEIERFKQILSDAAAASASLTEVLLPGQAGVITSSDGESKYLVGANGVEYRQYFQKGMMGAVFMDQAVNKYLSDAGLNVDNEALSEGKNHTEMEHHWDEAYGYFSKVKDYQLSGDQDRGYWGGYLQGLETDWGIASTVYEAYRTGRAAIVAKNMEIRDQQRDIIRENFEKTCMIKALHYLQGGKEKLNEGDRARAFHELSEGLGFIYSLRYVNSGMVSTAQSDEWVDTLIAGDGFWAEDIETRIDQVKTEIAETFGVDPNAAY